MVDGKLAGEGGRLSCRSVAKARSIGDALSYPDSEARVPTLNAGRMVDHALGMGSDVLMAYGAGDSIVLNDSRRA